MRHGLAPQSLSAWGGGGGSAALEFSRLSSSRRLKSSYKSCAHVACKPSVPTQPPQAARWPSLDHARLAKGCSWITLYPEDLCYLTQHVVMNYSGEGAEGGDEILQYLSRTIASPRRSPDGHPGNTSKPLERILPELCIESCACAGRRFRPKFGRGWSNSAKSRPRLTTLCQNWTIVRHVSPKVAKHSPKLAAGAAPSAPNVTGCSFASTLGVCSVRPSGDRHGEKRLAE